MSDFLQHFFTTLSIIFKQFLSNPQSYFVINAIIYLSHEYVPRNKFISLITAESKFNQCFDVPKIFLKSF